MLGSCLDSQVPQMRRFEFIDGKSSKFWEVEVTGSTLSVRYGRIGSAGQAQDKSFASAEKAQAEGDKLIREKTGKGYVDVGAPTPAAPAVAGALGNPVTRAATAPAPVIPTLPGNQTSAGPEAAQQASLSQSTDGLGTAPPMTPAAAEFGIEAQPPGEFLWTPAWRKALPVWRGETLAAPPPLQRQRCIEDFARRLAALQAHDYHQSTLAKLMVRAGKPMDMAMLDPVQLAACTDATHWECVMRAMSNFTGVFHGNTELPDLKSLWQLCASAHGLRFTLSVLRDAVNNRGRLIPGTMEAWGLDLLREHIAALDDADYAALCDDAVASGASGLGAGVMAYLFPTEPALLAPAVEALPATTAGCEAALLMACKLSEAQAQRVYSSTAGYEHHWSMWRVLHLNLARLRHPLALDNALDAFKRQYGQDDRRAALDLVRAHDSVETLAALLSRVEEQQVRAQLDPFAHEWPQATIRLAAELFVAHGNKALREWLERFVAAEREALAAALARADGVIRPLLEALAGKLGEAPVEAPVESLPDWLQTPPWRARARPAAAAYPGIVPHDVVPCMAWAEGERERWQGEHTTENVLRDSYYQPRLKRRKGLDLAHGVLDELGVRSGAQATALAGGRLVAADFGSERWSPPEFLMLLPPDCARVVLEAKDPRQWSEWGEIKLEVAVAWLDGLAVSAVETIAERLVERGLQLALPLASARVANVAANALRTAKKAKPAAQAWLLRHAQLAAAALLPQLGERKHSDDASLALRWLLTNGREAAVESAAEDYGDVGRAALATLRAFDPMHLAPHKIPRLPAFWLPTGYSRPLLRDGHALPLAVCDAIGEMLAFSPIDQRYAGLERLQQLCKPASLGAFAWDLFQSWLIAGAPSKEGWAFSALAHLGDDECARKLALLIRAWPGEGAHARAVAGLDVLAAIGSDVALMHLNGIAQKVKFKGLQEKARAKIEQIAQVRGFTSEELADRLVPDLGLDERGTLALDFGPRQFSVGFDETLKPFVRDASGAPLRDLPKPLKSDDAVLSEEAVSRWKALKKDARTLASQQIARLELAMAQRRRWSAIEFRRFFVEHPLLRHLVRRLLWARFEQGQPVQCLRVAEDLSYADANDDLLMLAEDAEIGLVHALELAPDAAAAFGQIFADYEILQPFAQLGRDVYQLTTEEQHGLELARYKDKCVATGSVFGLENRGWRRGDPQDGGWIGWFTRRVADDLEVALDLDPGTVVGDINFEPRQKLGALILRRPNSWGDDGRRRWSELDPILASEVLRDIDRLAQVSP
jgi:predicted DNA-binding WGR domain protein